MTELTQVAAATRKVAIVYKNPNELTPFFNNPRDNDGAVDDLMKSIDQFDFLVPIVVDKDGIIVTGHTRHKASLKMNLEEVPVIYASHLTDAQIKAFRIADNRLSENAKWDENKLSDELRSISDMGFDMAFTGFSAAELDCLCGTINASCLTELDYESVCGVVTEKEVVAKGTLIISMGNYKFYVDVPAYKAWEADLLQDFPKRADLVAELAKRLGFTIASNNVVGEKPAKEADAAAVQLIAETGSAEGDEADKAQLTAEAHATGDLVTGGE